MLSEKTENELESKAWAEMDSRRYGLNDIKKFGDEIVQPLRYEINQEELDKAFAPISSALKQAHRDMYDYVATQHEAEVLTLIAKKGLHYIKDLRDYCDRLIEHYEESK